MVYTSTLDEFLEEVSKNGPLAVPRPSRIERDFPIEGLYRLALNEGNRKRPVYEIHKWWARRLGVNFRMALLSAMSSSKTREVSLWRAFYSHQNWPKLVVLDPFMGGGTSVVESVKIGARVIGIDVDPVAWFVTKKEIDPVDLRLLKQEARKVIDDVRAQIGEFYRTICTKGHEADVVYFFWVDTAKCENCGTQFDGHPHYLLADVRKKEHKVALCSSCGTVQSIISTQNAFACESCGASTEVNRGNVKLGRYTCPNCESSFTVPDLPDEKKPMPKRLFALEYHCKSCEETAYKRAGEHDVQLFREADQRLRKATSGLMFPRTRIPKRPRSDPRPINYGYRRYADLFNARQLLGLSILYKRISRVSDTNTKEYLLLALSDALASNNMFCYYAFGYRKLTPMFGLHAFRPVPRSVEVNLLQEHRGRGSFPKCLDKVVRGKQFCYDPFESVSKSPDSSKRVYTGERIITTVATDYTEWESGASRCLLMNQSSESMAEIKDQTVDLILTDPPYYDNIPYAEYSDFYYVWLRRYIDPQSVAWKARHVPFLRPLYVNPTARRKDLARERYTNGLANVFKECKRVIKPRGMLVFSYHHASNEAWESLATALVAGGFRATNVVPLRSEGKSGFHSYEGSLKWDAIITCRPLTSRSRQVIGSLEPHAIFRWATTRTDYWSARAAKMSMSKNDLCNLRMALIAARLTQLRASAGEIRKAYLYRRLHTEAVDPDRHPGC